MSCSSGVGLLDYTVFELLNDTNCYFRNHSDSKRTVLNKFGISERCPEQKDGTV